MQLEKMAPLGRWLKQFGRHVVQRVKTDNVPRVASALSYTSLLALVPLLAISVAILSAFPAFDTVREQIQNFVLDNFVPTAGFAVQQHLSEFVGATGELTAVGVAGLAVTSILMLSTMEQALNGIFRVTRPRSLLGRVLVYWTVLTLGPLLIGASFTLASWLTAVRWLSDVPGSGMLGWAPGMVPTLLTVAAFTLLYMAVPNRPVRLGDALAGAVVAALLFAGLRFGFILYVASARAYQTIYGALAAIPLFLVWMYLSWMVVLVGAVIAASLPEVRLRRTGAGHASPEARLTLALDVLRAVGEAAREGRGLGRKQLLRQSAAPEAELTLLLDALHAGGFVAPARHGGWVPVRPLAEATVLDLFKALGMALPGPPPEGTQRPWGKRLADMLATARETERTALDVPLDRLLFPERAGADQDVLHLQQRGHDA